MVDIKQPISIQGIPSAAIQADRLRIDTGLGYSADDYTSRVIMSCEETADAFVFSVIKNFINNAYARGYSDCMVDYDLVRKE